MNIYYLNNNGSRFKPVNKADRYFTLYINGFRDKIRTADCFEQFGNFALTVFRYKGKIYKGFPRDTELDSGSGLPIIDLDRCKQTSK